MAEWVRLVEDAEEEKHALTQIGNELLDKVASATPETASGGLAPLDEMSSRAGIGLLATLRSDVSYVAGVMTKTHQQGIYLGEIMEASSMLDSVLSLLERRNP